MPSLLMVAGCLPGAMACLESFSPSSRLDVVGGSIPCCTSIPDSIRAFPSIVKSWDRSCWFLNGRFKWQREPQSVGSILILVCTRVSIYSCAKVRSTMHATPQPICLHRVVPQNASNIPTGHAFAYLPIMLRACRQEVKYEERGSHAP